MLCPFCYVAALAQPIVIRGDGTTAPPDTDRFPGRVEMEPLNLPNGEPMLHVSWTPFDGKTVPHRLVSFICPRCGFVALFNRPEGTP